MGEEGDTVSWGKGSPPSQVMSKQETESRVERPVTYKVAGAEVTNFLLA